MSSRGIISIGATLSIETKSPPAWRRAAEHHVRAIPC
jgi:hypothetical protein